jgi:alpha-L-fucosidase
MQQCVQAVFQVLLLVTLASAAASAAETVPAPSLAALVPTPEERDARLGWWREARFGMFIHWGVYSTLSGTWHGKKFGGYAEHIQRAAKISLADYRKEVVEVFNPTDFAADAWVALAKQAGMGYLIITAKHHDGFAMYDSQVSDYNIVKATPWHRDPMIALRDACKRQHLRFGFYYSHAFDWGEADAPGNDWDYQNPGGDLLLHGADWWVRFPEFLPKARAYVDRKAIPQIRELIAKYDPDILWFDTPHKLPPEENLRILAAVRAAKPSLVINGRLVHGAGDYASTADRPAEFRPEEGDWEGVPTTNESYGYNENDRSHKPPAHFIRLLAKSAARGGNVLLNVGPMGSGRIDPKDVEILAGIGTWWQENGESIRGTSRTPLPVQAWGESTVRGNRLYLHVFTWPHDGRLVIGGLRTPLVTAALLADPGRPLAIAQTGPDPALVVPATAPNAVDSVIVCELAGPPQTDPVRVLSAALPADSLRVFDGAISAGLGFGAGKVADAHVVHWTRADQTVTWKLRTETPYVADLRLVYDAPNDTPGAVVAGDAGNEAQVQRKGAGGSFTVSIGTQVFIGHVRQGQRVGVDLGRIALQPGTYDLIIRGATITGAELFRPREVVLTPRP